MSTFQPLTPCGWQIELKEGDGEVLHTPNKELRLAAPASQYLGTSLGPWSVSVALASPCAMYTAVALCLSARVCVCVWRGGCVRYANAAGGGEVGFAGSGAGQPRWLPQT